MEVNFKHFLITHFNLLNFPLGITDSEQWIKWTRDRIQLFKTYCLPSLLNQTNKKFTWLIYFDKQTPAEFTPFIEELRSYDFIKPCFADGFDGFGNQYMNEIKELCQNYQWVITSRIDNDDCFDKDAIDTIQRNFRTSDEYLISLTSGYTLDTNSKTLSHYYYPMSPFISMVENLGKPVLKGIWYTAHSKWDDLRFSVRKVLLKKNSKSIFIIDKPHWLQILHGSNIANSARGLPVLKKKDLSNFGINITSEKQTIRNIPDYYDYVIWKRYFKVLVVKLLRGK